MSRLPRGQVRLLVDGGCRRVLTLRRKLLLDMLLQVAQWFSAQEPGAFKCA